jgi:hypothetical protein
MALMAAKGEIGPMPYCATFADTGDEPKSVYDWLIQLEGWLPFPVVKVSVGKLSLAATSPRPSKSGGYLKPSIPVFFDTDGKRGHGQRHCTADFKITPVIRFANSVRRSGRVRQWMGISTDEAHRMKKSKIEWCDNVYPLVDADMSRTDCLTWMSDNGFPKPPRSACVFCPFHSDSEWLRLQVEEPDEFAAAVQFEKRYQEAATQTALDGIPYLHVDRKPLDTINFVPGQHELQFGNECEGMCGI